jgi:hypothetical protein
MTGRVAQRESTPFTREGSQVRSLSRPPPKLLNIKAVHRAYIPRLGGLPFRGSRGEAEAVISLRAGRTFLNCGAQLAAAGAAQASQPALFATLHDDRRPPAERTASGVYLQRIVFRKKSRFQLMAKPFRSVLANCSCPVPPVGIGTIAFPATLHSPPFGGTLIYIKPSIPKGLKQLPADIFSYRVRHPEFPHEPTREQWFTEGQFESYRELGYLIGLMAFQDTPD